MAHPIEPDDHGEELGGGNNAAREHEQQILDALSVDLEGSPAEKLAAQLVPVVPDGGNLGRTVAPHVSRISKTRDGLRIWGPAIATTAVTTTAVAVLPLPGPLALYVLAIAAFGWWHCAGRPGAVEAVRMLAYALTDTAGWIRDQVTRLAVRRGRYEARRTRTQSPSE
ncbi:hypothetical protein [Nocardia brasiliensis]|uniref:hypothetical protein n=1 Tax=Nocardia brasiliensis TaxID=37326 RepID=UPI002457F015|nr:hypothetical protein [Nocardia brasiliensis]